VFVTAHGVVLVDTKYADRYEAMIEQVRTITDKPITHVINTHCHGDHMGGNQSLPPGVEIIVQENTARNMEEMRRSWDPNNEHGRPLRTYTDTLTLFSGDDAIDLYYFGAAHTDGDTFVVFRSAGVMHAGDVFPDKVPPIVNIAWGGNGVTYGETIGRAAAQIPDVTYVIPGHGAVTLWDDFVAYGDFNRLLLAQARDMRQSGGTPEHAARQLRLPPKFNDYQLGRLNATLDEISRGIERGETQATHASGFSNFGPAAASSTTSPVR